jgi:hypothetical protein
MDNLEIVVEGREMGWSYRIQHGNEIIAQHDPCWPWNQTDESARTEAVGKALEILGRQADAVTVASTLECSSISILP